jgi:hypothetical protein
MAKYNLPVFGFGLSKEAVIPFSSELCPKVVAISPCTLLCFQSDRNELILIQVILKPDPGNALELYLGSLEV